MKHACQWSSPARLSISPRKTVGWFLDDWRIISYGSYFGPPPFPFIFTYPALSRYSVVANTDAAKPTHTPIATAALKTLASLSIALSSLSNILRYSLEMPLGQINHSSMKHFIDSLVYSSSFIHFLITIYRTNRFFRPPP